MMTKQNRDIGDPLEEVAQTGKIGRRSQAPKSANFQTSEMSKIQNVESPKFQQPNSPDIQNLKPPAAQDFEMSKVQTSKGTHKGRTQKTIYLPPALAKRLNFASVEEEREISEIVTDALEAYFKKKAKENN